MSSSCRRRYSLKTFEPFVWKAYAVSSKHNINLFSEGETGVNALVGVIVQVQQLPLTVGARRFATFTRFSRSLTSTHITSQCATNAITFPFLSIAHRKLPWLFCTPMNVFMCSEQLSSFAYRMGMLVLYCPVTTVTICDNGQIHKKEWLLYWCARLCTGMRYGPTDASSPTFISCSGAKYYPHTI